MSWRKSGDAYFAAGLCRCSRPRAPGRTKCKECLFKMAFAQAKRRLARKKGQCRDCGRPARARLCATCSEVLARARAAARAKESALESSPCPCLCGREVYKTDAVGRPRRFALPSCRFAHGRATAAGWSGEGPESARLWLRLQTIARRGS